MSVERVTARAEAVSIVCVGTPARSLSRARSRISPGGVSSINWTNGSIVSGYSTRLGIGIVGSPRSAVLLFGWFHSLDVGGASPPARFLLARDRRARRTECERRERKMHRGKTHRSYTLSARLNTPAKQRLQSPSVRL